MPVSPPPLPRGTLAIAIPSHNSARMLARIVGEILPTCEALQVDVCVSDNGSSDDTPAVCADLARASRAFRFRRFDPGIPLEEHLVAAMEPSGAEYTWAIGDDDFVFPDALVEVARVLAEGRPSAIVTNTAEVDGDGSVNLGVPVLPQLARFAPPSFGPRRRHRDAAAFFGEKFYNLPLRTVVYRTRDELSSDYARYYGTFHPHIGGLFDYLAKEQGERGEVDIVEIPETCTVSLTVMHDKGKTRWSNLFEHLGRVGFPRWFSLLPPLYAPHIEAGLAYHRHIFRHVLDEENLEPRDAHRDE